MVTEELTENAVFDALAESCDDVRPLSDLDIITLRSNLRLRGRSVALAYRLPREASQP